MAIARVNNIITEDTQDTLVFECPAPYLLSVIATNTNDAAVKISVWVRPGDSDTPGYLVNELSVSAHNSYETFRFAMNLDDDLYVSSDAPGVSFFIQGTGQ